MKISETTKQLQKLTETEQDTGKFVNAQRVGRNISIGLAIIFAGILYAIGGISAILIGFGVILGITVFLAIVLYTLIVIKVI